MICYLYLFFTITLMFLYLGIPQPNQRIRIREIDRIRELDERLYKQDLGIMYMIPVSKG